MTVHENEIETEEKCFKNCKHDPRDQLTRNEPVPEVNGGAGFNFSDKLVSLAYINYNTVNAYLALQWNKEIFPAFPSLPV